MLTFLIMAGGSGERFWPLSTREKPKQLLKIFNEKSLIRLAYERILPLVDKNQIFIATNEIQVPAMKEELPEVLDSRIIIEPAFRDTASAIAYGSMMISKYYENPTICVLASDHLITNEEEFRSVIKIAELQAEQGNIVTLGIKPTYPETGYGYIEVEHFKLNCPVASLGFKEKPELELARQYVARGTYLWNSGMFIFKHSVILEALKIYSPNHFQVISSIDKKITENKGLETAKLVLNDFLQFEKKSIDFAVMEHAKNIVVIPSDFGWNDVGNFTAFEELFEKDNQGNVIRNVKCISVDSTNNIIVSDCATQRISLLGVHDMIVVVNQKEILLCAKEKNQEIKRIIKMLE